ncbi:hypothetical protein ABPG72_015316 [Tetrahymena utriculariae]
MNQQDLAGQTLIHSCQFFDFTYQNPVMEFIKIYELVLDKIQVKSILLYDNMYSSIISINQCNNITITVSKFINNTNTKGIGGSIYSTNNQLIKIQNTVFKLNQCQQQNGEALSLKNSIKITSLTILNSVFIDNQAQLSSGGAINLMNCNLVMKNSIISSNKAQIGGVIYYQEIIPGFVLDSVKQINNNNIVSQNFAKLYGNNLGSTLRNEESNKIFIPSSANYNNSQQYCNDVQSILQQMSISQKWDLSTQQIQCLGELQSKQFTNNGFKLNAQIMYKPNSQMTLQVISNLFPKLSDSKGNVYLEQDYLFKNITINFDSCLLGQIVIQQSNSIVCEDFPEGKNSLSLQDNSCLQCPESAVKCNQSAILLKNGYWRENQQTGQIIYSEKSFNYIIVQQDIKALFVIHVILMEKYGARDINKFLVGENATAVRNILIQQQQKTLLYSQLSFITYLPFQEIQLIDYKLNQLDTLSLKWIYSIWDQQQDNKISLRQFPKFQLITSRYYLC